MITRNDILDMMSSRTCQSSADEPEGMMAEAELVRASDALAGLRLKDLKGETPALRRLAWSLPATTAGVIVCQCLRTYEEHRSNPDRALAAVYEWARRCAPGIYPTPLRMAGLTPETLASVFAQGKAKHAKTQAADLYADCFLVMSEFVAERNRRKMRAVCVRY